MPLTKAEKRTIIDQLTTALPASKAVVFANYQGTTVKELTDLRDKLAEKGLKFTVTKNTLLKKVLNEVGYSVDEALLSQPVGITVDEHDEVQPAKILSDFAKEHEQLKLVGALVNGNWIDAKQVAVYAKLPSRDQLLGQVVGTIAAPLGSFIRVMSGNLRGLVSVLKQYQEQQA